MTKLLHFGIPLALVLSGTAFGQTVPAPKKHKLPAATEMPATASDPIAMQKWFSGAVDNILTDTNKSIETLDGHSP